MLARRLNCLSCDGPGLRRPPKAVVVLAAMSHDVVVFDEELRTLEERIAACLEAVEGTSGDASVDQLNRAQELLKVASKTLHHFKVEIRQLYTATCFPELDRRSKDHATLISAL